MHSRKLLAAFPVIPFETFEQPVHIVDWGCSQGTASMVLLDYLSTEDIQLNISTITLIEPSEIALQQASLHTDKFDNTTRLITINKLLDQVNTGDFKISAGITVHLFSNILDIDAISLKRLTGLIKTTFKGENYFVCVSPYVTELKKHRLDIFMLAFGDRHLEILETKNNKAGTWERTWTRVSRVFKATL